MSKLRVLDLFSGIGGFSLGLERTGGFETVAFCEIDPFCRRVLAKHWPHVRQYEDVRELTAKQLKADGIAPDVICGGFPCQDISTAGKGAGIDGERSGLWKEYARLIGELRPQYVIVENVAALLARGLHRVLGDLASIGYDAEWHCIPASAIGAPHRRDRLWLVANPRFGRRGRPGEGKIQQSRRAEALGASKTLADTNDQRELQSKRREQDIRGWPSHSGADVADAEPWRLAAGHEQYDEGRAIFLAEGSCERGRDNLWETWWPEPDVGRVAYGIPFGMERIQALGNAVVPQIPEIIGRAILQARAA